MISSSSPIDHTDSISAHSDASDWVARILENWNKSIKKIRKSKQRTKFSRKLVKQLQFGLDHDLITRADPLVKHLSIKADNEDVLEQIATLSESVAASIRAFAVGADSFSPKPEDVREPTPLLAGFSAILAANQVRRMALKGTPFLLKRVINALESFQLPDSTDEPDSILLYQWLAIEVPLTISSQLHELKPARKEGKRIAQRFVETTRELLDSDGCPNSVCLPTFGPLIASWIRCIKLADQSGLKLGSSFMAQMEWVPEQFVRLHDSRKKLLFANDNKTTKSFAEFVLALESDDRGRCLAEANGLIRKTKKSNYNVDPLNIEPSCVSEWARSAILKCSWKPESPLLGVNFSGTDCQIELGANEKLATGTLRTQVLNNGEFVEWDGDGFEVVCELIDEDISYIELELRAQNVTLHRQLLLSKTESFLLFADAITNQSAGELDYRIHIPLARDIHIIRENGTRELYLNREGKGIQSLVLPLALPEWSAERCRGLFIGESDENGESLRVEKTVQIPNDGGALYCPLFFDLDPIRSRRKRTWRQLTVAEDLNIVPAEIASAFRVQVDEQQWIFYRALQSIGNRTFMGQNFSGDFFAAQFMQDGSIKELIQID